VGSQIGLADLSARLLLVATVTDHRGDEVPAVGEPLLRRRFAVQGRTEFPVAYGGSLQ
jgi:hypothetical protein